MKTVSRMLSMAALVGVAGCSSLPGANLAGTFGAESFLGLDVPGQGYSAELGRGYQRLAQIAAVDTVNWMDASAYAAKGHAAIAGADVQPWAPSALGLSGEVDTVYSQLVSAVNANSARNPVACAKAVTLYDYYLELLAEGPHACTDPALIYAELQDAMAACGYSAAPAPAPVDACAYADVPSGCTCANLDGGRAAVTCPQVTTVPVADACAAADIPSGCTCSNIGNGQAAISCPQPAAPVYQEPAPVYQEPAPVYQEPAPVVETAPYDACDYADVPSGCTCAGGSGYPIITCEKIVTREVEVPVDVVREVERVVEVEVPVERIVYQPAPAAEPAPVYTPEPVYTPAPVITPEPVSTITYEQPAFSAPTDYTIYFGYDRYDLTAEARQVIDEAVAAFRGYAARFMDVTGHTDTRGSKAYNTRLAQRRADAVGDALVARGVDSGSVRTSARSELDPAISSGDGVREALNRRVTIQVVQ